MGIGGISIWQLLILLLIVALVFGTKRLRSVGSDLGAAIKGFRKGMEEEKDRPAEQLPSNAGDGSAANSETQRNSSKPSD